MEKDPFKREPFPGDVAILRVVERLDVIKRTSVDVAEAVGCSPKHLSMIFNGHVDPSYDLMRRLWKEVMWK